MTETDSEASPDGEPVTEEPGDDLGEEFAERFWGDRDRRFALRRVDSLDWGQRRPLFYSRPDAAFKRFAKWCSYLAGVALAVVTIVCFVDVILAKLGQGGIPSQFDLIANLNLVMVFLAVFYVQMDRGSVSIELLQDHFPTPVRLGIRIFGSLLGAAASFFCAYRGWYYLADFWETHKSASGVWHFPIWPAQAVLVFGFFCLGVAFLFTIARDITDCRLKRGKYAPKPGKPKKQTGPSASEQISEVKGQILDGVPGDSRSGRIRRYAGHGPHRHPDLREPSFGDVRRSAYP